MKKWFRWIPLLVIIALMAFLYFSGYYKAINYETLRYHHVEMTEFVDNHPILTPLIFIGIYAFSTALSIPWAVFLSLLGGFLFPQPLCTLYVVIGATIGATGIFLAARTGIGNFLKEKAGPFLKKMEKGFQENAASYLLFLRFIPFFPFWVVNLAPAFFNIRLKTFIWTTFVGIIPGAFINTQAGRGLNAIFESDQGFTFDAIFNTQMKIALALLGIFSLVPIIIKKWKKKKDDRF